MQRLALYACSTGGGEDEDGDPGTAGEGGFADTLRDCWARCIGRDGLPCRTFWIDSHDRAGHTTSNPYVVRMEGGQGPRPAAPIWSRRGQRAGRAGRKLLKDRRGSSLRLRYPVMTRAEGPRGDQLMLMPPLPGLDADELFLLALVAMQTGRGR